MSKDIVIKQADGKTMTGYLALPADFEKGKHPGLVLIQEIFGVNGHIRNVADKLARQGFIVLAPDLFFRMQENVKLGYGEKDMQTGFSFYERFDEAKALEDLQTSVDTLRQMPGCNGKVGTIGFCLGGKMSFRAAAHTNIDVAICYYGGGIDQNLAEAKNITVPMTLHFASLDHYIPETAVAKIKEALSNHKDVEVYEYPGVDHGFNCDERGAYNKEASDLAFSRSVDKLHKVLGKPAVHSK